MKRLITIIIFTSIILLGCDRTAENPCSLSKEVLEGINRIDSLLNLPKSKQVYNMWMKNNYDEPSLYNAENETYRFRMSCFGSNDYNKIVRIEKRPNGYFTAIVKEFNGLTVSPDTKWRIYVFDLPKKDWELIVNKLESIKFWTTFNMGDNQLLHGCIWSVEGYNPIKNECTSQNYQAIGGNYPIDSSFVSICNLFDNIRKK